MGTPDGKIRVETVGGEKALVLDGSFAAERDLGADFTGSDWDECWVGMLVSISGDSTSITQGLNSWLGFSKKSGAPADCRDVDYWVGASVVNTDAFKTMGGVSWSSTSKMYGMPSYNAFRKNNTYSRSSTLRTWYAPEQTAGFGNAVVIFRFSTVTGPNYTGGIVYWSDNNADTSYDRTPAQVDTAVRSANIAAAATSLGGRYVSAAYAAMGDAEVGIYGPLDAFSFHWGLWSHVMNIEYMRIVKKA
jgi:hypothetical protein